MKRDFFSFRYMNLHRNNNAQVTSLTITCQLVKFAIYIVTKESKQILSAIRKMIKLKP